LILDELIEHVLTLRTAMESQDDAQQFIKQFGKFDDRHKKKPTTFILEKLLIPTIQSTITVLPHSMVKNNFNY